MQKKGTIYNLQVNTSRRQQPLFAIAAEFDYVHSALNRQQTELQVASTPGGVLRHLHYDRIILTLAWNPNRMKITARKFKIVITHLDLGMLLNPLVQIVMACELQQLALTLRQTSLQLLDANLKECQGSRSQIHKCTDRHQHTMKSIEKDQSG